MHCFEWDQRKNIYDKGTSSVWSAEQIVCSKHEHYHKTMTHTDFYIKSTLSIRTSFLVNVKVYALWNQKLFTSIYINNFLIFYILYFQAKILKQTLNQNKVSFLMQWWWWWGAFNITNKVIKILFVFKNNVI